MKTEHGFFTHSKTYSSDLALFEKLGLTPFNLETHRKEIVGKVDYPDGSWVTVAVHVMPAQFWTFDIYSVENRRVIHVDTGSGALADYWPIVEKILHGMFVVKSIEELPPVNS